MSMKTVPVIEGDGVGPEIMKCVCNIIKETGASIEFETHNIAKFNDKITGSTCDLKTKNWSDDIDQRPQFQEVFESVKKYGVLLKGPLETPIGYGIQSLNVLLRKMFQTFANLRPVRSVKGILTPYENQNIDLLIVRENLEDLYVGLEYCQTSTTALSLKLISEKGCERIIALAFECAKSLQSIANKKNLNKKVHCATKANIMKITEGMMKRVFEKISDEFDSIEAYHILVDNCAQKLVLDPTQFDVIVTTNVFGDILSDLASGLVGGLGFAPSVNIGCTETQNFLLFEAVHGTAPSHVGKNTINPTSVLLSAIQMLDYLDFKTEAKLVEKALFLTISQRKVTKDVANLNKRYAKEKVSLDVLSTTQFSNSICDNFGKSYDEFQSHILPLKSIMESYKKRAFKDTFTFSSLYNKDLVGIDFFIELENENLNQFGENIQDLMERHPFFLHSLSVMGNKLYPGLSLSELMWTQAKGDLIQARFLKKEQIHLQEDDIIVLMENIQKYCFWTHVEKLYSSDKGLSYT